MIKKVIGFICEVDKGFTDKNLFDGCGGSETWVIKLAQQFVKLNYHVIIFTNINYHYISNSIEYFKLSKLSYRLSYQHFDHIFIMRQYSQDIIDLLKEYNCCNNYYLVAHDLRLWKHSYDNELHYYLNVPNNSLSYYKDIESDEWNKKHIHCLFLMSSFHYEYNKDYYPESFIKIIGNGIDLNEFPKENVERDNGILWSSCYERGLDILIEKLYPIIQKEIPDFKIYCASYNNNLPQKYDNLDYVINLGKLSKQDLYIEMQKHKVWFYPNTFEETFCITLIENILSKTNISLPFKHGPKDILKYFKLICLKDGNYNDVEYVQYVAYDIIDKIKNYDKYKQLQEILYEYIKDEYSWENITNKINNILISYES